MPKESERNRLKLRVHTMEERVMEEAFFEMGQTVWTDFNRGSWWRHFHESTLHVQHCRHKKVRCIIKQVDLSTVSRT